MDTSREGSGIIKHRSYKLPKVLKELDSVRPRLAAQNAPCCGSFSGANVSVSQVGGEGRPKSGAHFTSNFSNHRQMPLKWKWRGEKTHEPDPWHCVFASSGSGVTKPSDAVGVMGGGDGSRELCGGGPFGAERQRHSAFPRQRRWRFMTWVGVVGYFNDWRPRCIRRRLRRDVV